MNAKATAPKDKRYTVTREYCGYATARYVVRFCGEFIASFLRKPQALAFAIASATARKHSQDDAFFSGYVECLYFCDTGEDGQPPSDAQMADEARDASRLECAKFEAENAELLSRAYARGYEIAQAGRDFYFTRNGHGVGFWDRDELKPSHEDGSENIGERLSEAARACGEASPYLGDDGRIYI